MCSKRRAYALCFSRKRDVSDRMHEGRRTEKLFLSSICKHDKKPWCRDNENHRERNPRKLLSRISTVYIFGDGEDENVGKLGEESHQEQIMTSKDRSRPRSILQHHLWFILYFSVSSLLSFLICLFICDE